MHTQAELGFKAVISYSKRSLALVSLQKRTYQQYLKSVYFMKDSSELNGWTQQISQQKITLNIRVQAQIFLSFKCSNDFVSELTCTN